MVFETYVSTNIRLQTYVYTNQVCEVSGNISDHVLVFRVHTANVRSSPGRGAHVPCGHTVCSMSVLPTSAEG
jgi:hypothetical protein